VVLDSGSELWKVGLSGEIGAQYVISTVMGHPKFSICLARANQKRYLVGEEAQHRYDSLYFHYSIERGLVTRWDDMERLWNHLFECGLGVTVNSQCWWLNLSWTQETLDRSLHKSCLRNSICLHYTCSTRDLICNSFMIRQNIFSHSVFCPFNLVIICFIVQKLLVLCSPICQSFLSVTEPFEFYLGNFSYGY
jgi:hypothetical protein